VPPPGSFTINNFTWQDCSEWGPLREHSFDVSQPHFSLFLFESLFSPEFSNNYIIIASRTLRSASGSRRRCRLPSGMRHAACNRARPDLPTCSLQLVHVHATTVHNFHLAPWRMVPCINMATLLVGHGLPVAAVGQLHDV
jgi:hypothetical protein